MIRQQGITRTRSRTVAAMATALLVALGIAVAALPAAGSSAKSASHAVSQDGRLSVSKARMVNLSSLPNGPVNQTVKVQGALRRDGTPSWKWQGTPGPVVAKPNAPQPLAAVPTHVHRNFAGINLANASCGCQPPDVNMAVGVKNLVETTNLTLAVYSKGAPPTLLKNTAFSTFLGTSDGLSDPRVIWDPTWKRFSIVLTDTSNPSLWMAFSTSIDGTAGWYIYHVGLPLPAGSIGDYPMIGQTQDALTFTTNNFTTSGYVSSWAFAVSKARVYNGLGWSVPLFGVTYDTAPTQVAGIPIDTSDGRAYFAAPNDANNVIYVYAMTSAGYGNASLAFLGGAAYNWAAPPRRINQPGTSTTLDPLDGRFVWAPMVLGGNIWFAHTVAIGSFPGVNYGFVTISSLAVTFSTAFHSGTSDDFNPSIGVFPGSPNPYVYLNWAYTDTPVGVPVSDTYSGLSPADSVQHLTGATLVTGFSTNEFRFGDYSSVSITPYAFGTCPIGQTAFVAQQYFLSDGTWATRIANVGFC